ncbi:MAG: hypothetical protein ABEI27_13260 [Halobellus sp.]|uniref:DUF7287 family protein n=1 Tax=Halobellus sp. TaxID=1979212 RepID=UPI0035D51FD7
MHQRTDRKQRTESGRAQTTIDFAIGISLFLVVVAAVVAFVPAIFAPFESTDGPQTADRIATSLSTDRLGDPAEPYALNETCTNAFFIQLDNGTNAPATCQFDVTADATTALFGLPGTRDVNVSIRTLDGAPANRPGGEYVAGPPVSEANAVNAAQRIVRFDGETYRLLVRVW